MLVKILEDPVSRGCHTVIRFMVPESRSSDRETVAFGQQLERGSAQDGARRLCVSWLRIPRILWIGLGDLKLGSQHTFKIWRRARVGSTALKPLGVLEWKVPGFFFGTRNGCVCVMDCYGGSWMVSIDFAAGRRHPSKMAPFTFPWPWGWDKWDKHQAQNAHGMHMKRTWQIWKCVWKSVS